DQDGNHVEGGLERGVATLGRRKFGSQAEEHRNPSEKVENRKQREKGRRGCGRQIVKDMQDGDLSVHWTGRHLVAICSILVWGRPWRLERPRSRPQPRCHASENAQDAEATA